ncbi:DUF5977 domain-containing protein [Chitinophaga sp. 30R24]|uniref:DUF5977 domain-containing protein n=1 Tax=Chitinophaga sp. 30R24 TaxID=3248838 RepID=UPI003B91BA7C
MILAIAARGKKWIAASLLGVMYLDMLIPVPVRAAVSNTRNIPVAVNTRESYTVPAAVRPVIAAPVTKGNSKAYTPPAKKADLGGPTQPETQTFHPAGTDNMVDLFSGDFHYSIPLLDVGGYPVTLGYNSGISMDQEASWVGLGWNINPGSITRNLRGLPDDFDGDIVSKELSIRDNETVGVNLGSDMEIIGLPMPLSLGGHLGVFKNTYKGWGFETAANASISAGKSAGGQATFGMSIANNSQTGLTISSTIGYKSKAEEVNANAAVSGHVSIGSSYNSRSGLSGLQLSGGVSATKATEKSTKNSAGETVTKEQQFKTGRSASAFFSFASPAYTPTINMPYTNTATTVTLKVGTVYTVIHPAYFISGYYTKQGIEKGDKFLSLPAYGYLNYEHANNNRNALLDFNREKDIPYRDKPAVPNIGVPSYTYDIFNLSGEGIGGNFRAYRNDIGYVYDNTMTTRDGSRSISADIGGGFIGHVGVDMDFTRVITSAGLWDESNPLKDIAAFRKTDKRFESAYFRSPGEKTINSLSFYEALGGDQLVTPRLSQLGNTAQIQTTNRLTPYQKGLPQQDISLNTHNVVKPDREKRTQVISYLTAKEAAEVGLSRYIENYTENTFSVKKSKDEFVDEFYGPGDGLWGLYYSDEWLSNYSRSVKESEINFPTLSSFDYKVNPQAKAGNYFSARYISRLKIPVSGRYTFKTISDDGVKLWMSDGKSKMEVFIDSLNEQHDIAHYATLDLEGGKLYDIELQYNQAKKLARFEFYWKSDALAPGMDFQIVPRTKFFTQKDATSFPVGDAAHPWMTREKRLNEFRKENHISEIDVLNNDGRRYVYGIPVYNLSQKETTFSVAGNTGKPDEGLVPYRSGSDDTPDNMQGRDRYFTAERMPPYAHSFLLTGILTPDYVDMTGDGISDDDAGNAIRFNYTKTAGLGNPYKWRAPYNNQATFNEGLKTDNRDDKGSYVSGTKEIWYLNSVESKSMVAIFTLGSRKDLMQIDSVGNKSDGGARLLKQIDLYVKADFIKNGAKARPVKTVHFNYSYELCPGINQDGSGKLTLKEVWFSYNGNDKGMKNAYHFNYNKLNPAYNPSRNDRWGNYKDPLQNPGSVAGSLINNSDYPYAIQDSVRAAANAAAWTLDSLVMPSGGKLKIDYESDDYAYVQDKRAMQMCKVAGLSKHEPTSLSDISNRLYETGLDNMYVSIHVPVAVTTKEEVRARYLDNIEKLYFRLFVKMPSDNYGRGSEIVSCYADIDTAGRYGFYNDGNTIWVKLKGISSLGTPGGTMSPLVKASMQFLRLNLPSKAYPGSDVGDRIDAKEAVQMLLTQADNIINTLSSFENIGRLKGVAQQIDLSRSLVRICSPTLKKYGGGLRVKRIVTYDNWSKMTGQRGATYGKEYTYTSTQLLNGEQVEISSGVASWEPMLGGEENPWRVPIEYEERVSALAPTTMGYTEEPLGEGFFPAPSVGYSKVRVRSIHTKNNRSANGVDETRFFTTRDFPTIAECTPINNDTRKRYKTPLGSLLRIYNKHYLAVSQGFKIELNDMNGKIRSEATCSETDPNHWITYTENFYHVDNPNAARLHLNNQVLTISPQGQVQHSEIGKDLELMLDMRQERSLTNGLNASANTDAFTIAVWPVVIPSLIPLPQREETVFRSVAATKVIYRHGILDSMVAIDKGSKVSTHQLLYDTETGDPVLTSVQNEYNDRVYNYTYPAGWIYEGMSGAYKNIGVTLEDIDIQQGRIVGGLSGKVTDYFFSGDEILAYARRKVWGEICDTTVAHWPLAFKVWAVDANMLKGGTPDIYFINQDGTPLSGRHISMKIIRSGRRNIAVPAGSVTMLDNPLQGDAFVLNNSSRIVNAAATEFKEFWMVPDRKVPVVIIDTFRNVAIDSTFLVTCGANQQSVKVTVPASKFSSVVSQQMANEIAWSYMEAAGPSLAKAQIGCGFYYSDSTSGYFQRNCPGGAAGDVVRYFLPAGADSSLVSKEEANNLAKVRLQTEGPAYAAQYGRCYYYNEPQTGTFTKNDCPSGTVGLSISYTVPANQDTSYTSVAAANQKAQARLSTEGQAYANANAGCTFYVKLAQVEPQQYTEEISPTERHDVTATSLKVSCFADKACTIPVTVTNQVIRIQQSIINRDGSIDYVHKSYSMTGSSAIVDSRVPVSVTVSIWDRGWHIEPDNIVYGYQLESSPNYIIVP